MLLLKQLPAKAKPGRRGRAGGGGGVRGAKIYGFCEYDDRKE